MNFRRAQSRFVAFPDPNRVISALADVVLVIEQKRKSGSLITVDYALEQEKRYLPCPDGQRMRQAAAATPDRAGAKLRFHQTILEAGREKGGNKKSRTASTLWKRGGNGSENTRGRTAESVRQLPARNPLQELTGILALEIDGVIAENRRACTWRYRKGTRKERFCDIPSGAQLIEEKEKGALLRVHV